MIIAHITPSHSEFGASRHQSTISQPSHSDFILVHRAVLCPKAVPRFLPSLRIIILLSYHSIIPSIHLGALHHFHPKTSMIRTSSILRLSSPCTHSSSTTTIATALISPHLSPRPNFHPSSSSKRSFYFPAMTTDTAIKPPSRPGMTLLDKSAFDRTLPVLAIRIPAAHLGVLRNHKGLEPYGHLYLSQMTYFFF